MEAKMDALISLLKMLILVLFVVCIVAIMYCSSEWLFSVVGKCMLNMLM